MKSFAKYPLTLLVLVLVVYSQALAPLYAFGIPSSSVKNIRETVHFQAASSKAADIGTAYFEEEQEEDDRHFVKKFFQTLASTDLFSVQLPEQFVQSVNAKSFINLSPHFSSLRAPYLVLGVFRI